MTHKTLTPMRANRGPSRATINRAITLLVLGFEADGHKVINHNHLPVCPDCRGEGHTADGPCYRCDGQG